MVRTKLIIRKSADAKAAESKKIVSKKQKKKDTEVAVEPSVAKKRTTHKGVGARRQIVRMQRTSSRRLLGNTAINRIIRDACRHNLLHGLPQDHLKGDNAAEMRISKGFRDRFAESLGVAILAVGRNARSLAEHAGRRSIMPCDIIDSMQAFSSGMPSIPSTWLQ